MLRSLLAKKTPCCYLLWSIYGIQEYNDFIIITTTTITQMSKVKALPHSNLLAGSFDDLCSFQSFQYLSPTLPSTTREMRGA